MSNSTASLRFLFLLCNDVSAIIAFYGDTLGLKTNGSADEGWASIDAGVELLFFKGDFPIPEHRDWAWQPGYEAGSGHLTSWSLEYRDEHSYRAAVERIAGKQVAVYQSAPEWRRDTYWGHTVRDPMGNTVEIYWKPLKKPDSLVW